MRRSAGPGAQPGHARPGTGGQLTTASMLLRSQPSNPATPGRRPCRAGQLSLDRTWESPARDTTEVPLLNSGVSGPYAGFRQTRQGPVPSTACHALRARPHLGSRGCHRRTAPIAPRCPPRWSQGPERVGRDEEHLADGVEADHGHREPAGQLVTCPHPEHRQQLHGAIDGHCPVPGPQVADHVVRVADEDVRVGDRGDAVEQVEEADYRQQRGGEDDQAEPAAFRPPACLNVADVMVTSASVSPGALPPGCLTTSVPSPRRRQACREHRPSTRNLLSGFSPGECASRGKSPDPWGRSAPLSETSGSLHATETGSGRLRGRSGCSQ